jgi:hypothetical protein
MLYGKGLSDGFTIPPVKKNDYQTYTKETLDSFLDYVKSNMLKDNNKIIDGNDLEFMTIYFPNEPSIKIVDTQKKHFKFCVGGPSVIDAELIKVLFITRNKETSLIELFIHYVKFNTDNYLSSLSIESLLGTYEKRLSHDYFFSKKKKSLGGHFFNDEIAEQLLNEIKASKILKIL